MDISGQIVFLVVGNVVGMFAIFLQGAVGSWRDGRPAQGQSSSPYIGSQCVGVECRGVMWNPWLMGQAELVLA